MMRTILGTTLGVLLLATAGVVSSQDMKPTVSATPAFDQLKSLAGEWQNKDGMKVIYSVVSNGSVLMEHMAPNSPHEMITMYSREGDRIIVTHYCAAGNQPTMQTAPSPAADGKYDFKFVRLSGAKSPDEGHMSGLTLTMPDKDHLTQVWTFDDNGKSLVDTFSYTRVK